MIVYEDNPFAAVGAEPGQVIESPHFPLSIFGAVTDLIVGEHTLRCVAFTALEVRKLIAYEMGTTVDRVRVPGPIYQGTRKGLTDTFHTYPEAEEILRFIQGWSLKFGNCYPHSQHPEWVALESLLGYQRQLLEEGEYL